ncbi:apolipoprotein D and lipocalin family protein [Rhizomicrobium palustre]|uniref:Outer membrane lipoprotein Blc n=1 Tax=Rhizomicrobium palustre TaxID=189966 RepID=A0A846MXS0_9PROT|nr:lipocalin family protein [Rhizomicrobium palustre]NIK87810.1 apolipoprotein D and lipocalin family protein [Rhizomicrobium palustre]
MSALVLLAAAFALAACSHSREELPPLKTVSHVDLNRYLGTWYEIGAIPQWFQQGCTATTATYSLRKDGQIDVLNACAKNSLDGPRDEAHGRAKVVDSATNAKLKVTFFWPFYGDYWIIELGENYDYAVIGHPSRDYFWILSRKPRMDEALYTAILARAKAQGYDITRVQKTLQRGG